MHKIIDSLYLHFPFCMHLCNYCDFFKRVPTNKEVDFNAFGELLEKSYIEHHKLIEKHGYTFVDLNTLYIGGGTPSLWGTTGANFLNSFLKNKNIKLNRDCEFTLEVNPKTWTDESLKAWQEIGVNRFSLGVQSLNTDMIKYLDRVHSINDVHETLNYFKENDLNFSMDFMLGLPHSEKLGRDVIGELKEALTYNPKHFSVYILTVKNNYPYFKDLPNEDWIEKEFQEVAQFLKEAGYVHYEVSNFAKPGFESKHNLNYWKSKTVAALGPSATGFLSEDRIRYKWKANHAELEVETLTESEFNLEKAYMGLRSVAGIRLEDYILDSVKVLQIKNKWKNLNYIHTCDEKIVLNSNGFLMLDSLMDDLFINGLK